MDLDFKIKNTDRTVGAILSNEISKIHGKNALPKNTLTLNFNGSAGQSFGAFAVKGLKMIVNGTTNDYFGKGLSGGTIIAKVPKKATFISNKNIITGNVALYGATSGEAYINGIAGERFCVRNSGATAVVEGVGDHGCEYMTGGIALILGKIGRNFAAGMSGGIAYLYHKNSLLENINQSQVEIEKLSAEDRSKLFTELTLHHKFTASTITKNILDNWEIENTKFIKVSPIEYKKALERIKKEELIWEQ